MPTPTLLDDRLYVPDDVTVAQAAQAVEILDRFLRDRPTTDAVTVKLVADDTDATITVPGSTLGLLVDILAQIAYGNAVTVAPVHAELTTSASA